MVGNRGQSCWSEISAMSLKLYRRHYGIAGKCVAGHAPDTSFQITFRTKHGIGAKKGVMHSPAGAGGVSGAACETIVGKCAYRAGRIPIGALTVAEPCHPPRRPRRAGRFR
jgi:hypothetical protein